MLLQAFSMKENLEDYCKEGGYKALELIQQGNL